MLEGIVRRLTLLGNEMKIEGKLLDGKAFDWSKYAGKVVLVDFWATWCGPCLAEIPKMRKCYDLYHDKGFEIVGISCDHQLGHLEVRQGEEDSLADRLRRPRQTQPHRRLLRRHVHPHDDPGGQGRQGGVAERPRRAAPEGIGETPRPRGGKEARRRRKRPTTKRRVDRFRTIIDDHHLRQSPIPGDASCPVPPCNRCWPCWPVPWAETPPST